MKVELSSSQAETLISTQNYKYTLCAAGVGFGKSFVGSYYVRDQIARSPGANGLITANTYRQLQNATLTTLFNELDKWRWPYSYNQARGILKVGSSKIFCYSLDNYNPIRGIEIGWGWLDETRDTKEEAFKVVMGRLRDRRASRLNLLLTSTPSGFNWLYDYFQGDRKTQDFNLITGKSHENVYLPKDYLQSLEDSYDEKVYQQEVLGKFININQGQVYYSFSRENNVHEFEMNKMFPVFIGMDFNVNPMTAVLFQVIDDKIFVFDEVFLMTSDTKETGQTIISKYGTGHRVIPDSTGKRTQTSSFGYSDHAILKELGFNVMPTRNPFRVDRYNCVNNLAEKRRLIIHPRCKKLINDLEKVSYKEGSNLPDTITDKNLTHISDALGYGCWYAFPIASRAESAQVLKR